VKGALTERIRDKQNVSIRINESHGTISIDETFRHQKRETSEKFERELKEVLSLRKLTKIKQRMEELKFPPMDHYK